MVAKGGHSLLQTSAIDALKNELIHKADVLTRIFLKQKFWLE